MTEEEIKKAVYQKAKPLTNKELQIAYDRVREKWERRGIELPSIKLKPDKPSTMKNKVSDLRDALFAQLEKLSDDSVDLDQEIKRATSMCDVAKVMIDSGRAETEFLKVANEANANISSKFFQITESANPQLK
jgi:hypothetical protein